MELKSVNIEKIIKNIEEILIRNKISENKYFIVWCEDFKKIYSSKHADIQLYIIYSLLFFTGNLFILRFLIKDQKEIQSNKLILEDIEDITNIYQKNYNSIPFYDFEYFTPFFNLTEKEDIDVLNSMISTISDYIFSLNIRPEFIFDYTNQNIISPAIRHKAGEYFTPSFLVRKMGKESYIFGEKVLDPCCGTGNFLIELVKQILSSTNSDKDKLTAINNIYGYDINPISIFLAKINIIFLVKDHFSDFKLNLFVQDSLFQKTDENQQEFNLVIGNPPWYTYRDIEIPENQEKIKRLAEELDIKPLPKNILNIEIASLFFYQAKNLYMKENAKIFFVITKGVITGSHTSRFRNFKGFKNVKLWSFDKKIEKIFNIDFICLYAQKSENLLEYSNKEIPAYNYALKNEIDDVKYYKNIELILKDTLILTPYLIEKKGNKIYTKKLISKEKRQELLPIKTSYYKKLFHKGADLNPRNLIFVNSQKIDDILVKINPDERIFKKAKSPWNKKEFKDEIVEKKYLFKTVKSTELLKFYIHDHYCVFLPLSRVDLNFNYADLPENANKFYDKINKIYLSHKKDTTKHGSLMENIDRWGKLINLRQLAQIKIAYNNSGSTLNAAVIQGDCLLTGDLCFYDTDNLDEAYYLSAILNSPIMTKQIKIMKSSRHIFKLPFEIPIRKFDNQKLGHQKLAELGKKCSTAAKKVADEFLNEHGTNTSKIKIQKILSEKLNSFLNQIDKIVIKELQ